MGHRLLLISSDDSLSETLYSYFRHKGYELERVTNEEQAIEKVEHYAPDVVLIDTPEELPNLGVDCLEDSLRDAVHDPLLQFIVICAKDRRADRMGWSPREQYEDYLTKPFDIEELNVRVRFASKRVKHNRLLIVDDDLELLENLRQYFIQQNYQVFVTSSGREVLRLALARHPNAILLDDTLPDMNYLDVVKQLRALQSTKHIPFIFMTEKQS
jgi:DNA-binding response OmpR family regulator